MSSSEDSVMTDSTSNNTTENNIIDVLGDGGIIKKILKYSTEEGEDYPPVGADVTVHYVGTLASNGKKFDSSRDRSDPFKFKIGQGQVIKGWDEGVATMKRGEVALFTLKPEYAYGKNGSPPTIPPNSTLNFEVELIDFNDEEEVSQGITKKTVAKGEGYRKAEEDAATVVCSYKIYKRDDESRVLEQVDNLQFTFGDENVVQFLEEAIGSMKLNEKAVFTISEFKKCRYLEYTSHTAEFKDFYENELSKVRMVLKVEAHLKSIENEKNSWELTPEEKLDIAEQKKDQGNDLFKKNRIELAQKRYERALKNIEDESPEDEPEDQKKRRSQIISSAHSNLSAIFIKKSDWTNAIAECDKVLEIDNENIKSYYRKAQSFQALGELEEAKATLETCIQVCGNSTSEAQVQLLSTVKTLLTKVTKAINDQNKKEKEMFGKMFK